MTEQEVKDRIGELYWLEFKQFISMQKAQVVAVVGHNEDGSYDYDEEDVEDYEHLRDHWGGW
jgi:hypothetical protein